MILKYVAIALYIAQYQPEQVLKLLCINVSVFLFCFFFIKIKSIKQIANLINLASVEKVCLACTLSATYGIYCLNKCFL